MDHRYPIPRLLDICDPHSINLTCWSQISNKRGIGYFQTHRFFDSTWWYYNFGFEWLSTSKASMKHFPSNNSSGSKSKGAAGVGGDHMPTDPSKMPKWMQQQMEYIQQMHQYMQQCHQFAQVSIQNSFSW